MKSFRIYDVGLHDGLDSDYYLSKGYRVIAIDANAVACERCSIRMRPAIDSGQLVILNTAVADFHGTSTFYRSDAQPALSTLFPERHAYRDYIVSDWEAAENVPVTPLSEIIREHGPADYIKIDIEFADSLVLADLLAADIRPPYISTESHDEVPFRALLALGYRRFKLIDGATVGERFGNHAITRLDGATVPYAFRVGASGPFGDDLDGDWLDGDAALRALTERNFGWVDVHACL
jgi:FkbM family methyltransferase